MTTTLAPIKIALRANNFFKTLKPEHLELTQKDSAPLQHTLTYKGRRIYLTSEDAVVFRPSLFNTVSQVLQKEEADNLELFRLVLWEKVKTLLPSDSESYLPHHEFLLLDSGFRSLTSKRTSKKNEHYNTLTTRVFPSTQFFTDGHKIKEPETGFMATKATYQVNDVYVGEHKKNPYGASISISATRFDCQLPERFDIESIEEITE